ncbi:MAG: DUF2288 domain-containing protein [Gammaproteobacteria bacterium]|nr:DUF2288 domain-containing protein [Gammaproteobacteria bacterium]
MSKQSDKPTARADVNDPESIESKLNQECARVDWKEITPHFARGHVINVDPSLDLIAVAAAFAKDRQDRVKEWLDAALVERANDTHARRWEEIQPDMWAVVVRPWVLVQEIPAE